MITKSLANGITMADLIRKGRTSYPNVFSPLKIKNIIIPNRIYFSPFGIDNAYLDGRISKSQENFYIDIAKGGCGLVMLSNCSVSPDSILNPRGLKIFNNGHSDALSGLVKKMRGLESILGIQLQHYGAQAVTTHSKKDLISPSGIGCKYYSKKDDSYKVRVMTIDDIEEVKSRFIHAAVLSANAGVKFIQLQASNGYLLHSFISPYTNTRTDIYGGNYHNRIRLLVEIIQGIKSVLGNSIILSATVGINDFLGEDGVTPQDYQHIMPILESSGLDLITVSVSIAETFKNIIYRTKETEEKLHQSIVEIQKYKNNSFPLGFSGFTSSIKSAEHLISSGMADLVGMGRSIFADNNLILKSVDQVENSITRCLWDGNCFKDKSHPFADKVYCCVNSKYKRPDHIKHY